MTQHSDGLLSPQGSHASRVEFEIGCASYSLSVSAFTMRREQSIQRLWLIAILCSIAIFVGIRIIGYFFKEHVATIEPDPFTWGVAALIALPFQEPWILPVACSVPVFMGFLIWVTCALWSLYKSPEKSNLPSPRTQTEGGISESPQTQTEGSSKESGPPPLPLPRRPR